MAEMGTEFRARLYAERVLEDQITAIAQGVVADRHCFDGPAPTWRERYDLERREDTRKELGLS